MFLTGNNLGVRCKEKSLTGRIQEALGMVLRALGSVVGCILWSCVLQTIPLQPTSFFPVPSHYRVMSQQERVAITKQNYTVPLTTIKKIIGYPHFPCSHLLNQKHWKLNSTHRGNLRR